jgi:hypothetical protein
MCVCVCVCVAVATVCMSHAQPNLPISPCISLNHTRTIHWRAWLLEKLGGVRGGEPPPPCTASSNMAVNHY